MYFSMSQRIFRRIKIALLALFVVLFLGTGYIYYEFTYRGEIEPKTKAFVTSTDPLWSMEEFRKGFKQYKQLYQASMVAPKGEKDNGTYVIPGLHSTKTLAGNNAHRASICTSMTPQGIAVSNQYIFVSSYCHTKTHNSVIYVIDKKSHKFVKELVLPGKPHVGSLAYDEEFDNLWVCGSGKGLAQANAISLSTIESYSLEAGYVPISYKFQNNVLEIKRSSFMTYMDHHIYIGFFHTTQNGVLKKYHVESNGNLYRSMFELNGMNMESGLAISSAVIPKQTQGMAFYYDKLFLSQSLGILPSRLVLFDDAKPNKTYQNEAAMLSVKLPSMLEQVYIYNDELYMIFESAAFAYRDLPTFSVDRIIKVDVSELKRLINEDLQEQRALQKQELKTMKEKRKTERWRQLSDLPWISHRIQLYTPQLLPKKQGFFSRYLQKKTPESSRIPTPTETPAKKPVENPVANPIETPTEIPIEPPTENTSPEESQ